MSRRVLLGLLAALAVAGIAVTAVVLTTSNAKCGGGYIAVSDAPTGNAAGPIATSSGEEYWTEERMRNAKPAPMPTVDTC